MCKILKRDPSVRNVVISGVFASCDDPQSSQEARATAIIMQVCPEISCTQSREVSMYCLPLCS